jgi:hypothetical protein
MNICNRMSHICGEKIVCFWLIDFQVSRLKKLVTPSSLNFSSRIKSHYNSCSCICLSFAALSVSKLYRVVNMTDCISRNLKSRKKFSYLFLSNSVFLGTGWFVDFTHENSLFQNTLIFYCSLYFPGPSFIGRTVCFHVTVLCNALIVSHLTHLFKLLNLLIYLIYMFLFLCLCILIVCVMIIVPAGTLRLPGLRVFRAFSSVVRLMPE